MRIKILLKWVCYCLTLNLFRLFDYGMVFCSESKFEKGYISLGMSKRMSKGYPRDRGQVMDLLIGGEFLHTRLTLVNSKKDILLDIPSDMYPFSVFGSV